MDCMISGGRRPVLFVSFPAFRQQPLVCDSWTLPGPSPVPSAMQTAIRIIDRQWWRMRFGKGGLEGHQTDHSCPLRLLYSILLSCLLISVLVMFCVIFTSALNNSSHMVLWPATDGLYSDTIKTLICLSPDTDLFSLKILTVGKGRAHYRRGNEDQFYVHTFTRTFGGPLHWWRWELDALFHNNYFLYAVSLTLKV